MFAFKTVMDSNCPHLKYITHIDSDSHTHVNLYDYYSFCELDNSKHSEK